MAVTQDMVRGILTQAKTVFANASVSVVIGSSTGTGMKGPTNIRTEPDEFGEGGITSGSVRVSLADFSQPTRGQTITVDGVESFVITATPDEMDANMLIAYDNQRPVE
jgi:hypothetical protein